MELEVIYDAVQHWLYICMVTSGVQMYMSWLALKSTICSVTPGKFAMERGMFVFCGNSNDTVSMM